MKKLMLCSILSILFFNVYSQDTTCTMFSKKLVFEFDYQTDRILWEKEQDSKFYDVTIKYGDVLCLHLYDQNKRFRKVITEFFDGSTNEEILESKSNVYYSPRGAVRVSVRRPTLLKI